jgi:hypothetical protein
MSKIISIKLTRASNKAGPFNIVNEHGNVIASDVSKKDLISGVSYSVDDSVNFISVRDNGGCGGEKIKSIGTISPNDYYSTEFVPSQKACLWRHLTDVKHFNHFYGVTHPYIIEYPFYFGAQDEILQNVIDYTKTYKYIPDDSGVFSYAEKVETDGYFNKVILYNGQQSSGILELEPKPINNLQKLMTYPKYNSGSKTILYTKTDNLYQYNTFYDVVKDRSKPLFVTSCDSLSTDKVINNSNMDYTNRSFKRAPLRAKEIKIRNILDDKNDIHLVSQFILGNTMISYK